jgi:hypothetical protein
VIEKVKDVLVASEFMFNGTRYMKLLSGLQNTNMNSSTLGDVNALQLGGGGQGFGTVHLIPENAEVRVCD